MEAAAAPGQERPWPAGAAGGALFGARPPGPCRCSARRGRGGRGWELGVGVAAGAPWPPRWREAKRGEVLKRTPSSASRTPGPLERGDKGTLRALGMEMVLGKRATPSWGGGKLPEDEVSKDPHPQRTHTLVGRPARLTQALPLFAGTRRARPRTYVHAYIYPYIRAHRHTSRTPAPTGAPSLAQNPLQRLHVQAARTHNPWPYRATDHNRV